jgi:hypothetical protein
VNLIVGKCNVVLEGRIPLFENDAIAIISSVPCCNHLRCCACLRRDELLQVADRVVFIALDPVVSAAT